MKTIKRYLALVVIVNTMVLSACGGTGSDQQTLKQGSEEATTADAQQENATYSIDNNVDYQELSDTKKKRLLAYMNMLQNTKE